MTPRNRLELIEDLFTAALEREPAERITYLQQACAGDASLLAEVVLLIDAHDESLPLIDRPALADLMLPTTGSDAAAVPLSPGEMIGGYQILDLLGRGGMGVVYLAEDPRLNRRVAIKMLPDDVTTDALRLRRFAREAHAISTLNHPNIITIYEIDESSGRRFMATEYIEGRTLRQMSTGSRLPLGDILSITIQIVRALAAAHAAGIVHRDIKPENIMIRPDGLVKVLDFGLASLPPHFGQSDGRLRVPYSSLSIPGLILGTPNYMSPEQACGHRVDFRSDLFSLGVVLYELLAGCQPFVGSSPPETIATILTSEPPSLAEVAPQTPVELQTIVARALCKDAQGRYQTAETLLRDLEAAERTLELTGNRESAEPMSLDLLRGVRRSPDAIETLASNFGSGKFLSRHALNSAKYLLVSVRSNLHFSLGLASIFLFLLGIGVPRLIDRRESIEAIAILPVVNTGDDPHLDYLVDGLTEGLINGLARLPNLKVISRTTVFRYKGTEIDPAVVAQQLQVEALMTGQVVKQGSKLLISLQLTDPHGRRQLWGDRYEREQQEISSLLADVVRAIGENLGLDLSDTMRLHLANTTTSDPAAYELFLWGRHFWNKRSEDALRKSIDFYRQATDKDPALAAAYAGMAAAQMSLGANFLAPSEMISQARENVAKALLLDPSLPDAHESAAAISFAYDWDWATAEREIRTTLDYNPNHVSALCLYSNLLRTLNRTAEAIEISRRAVAIDPLSILAVANLGSAYYAAGYLDQGDEQYRKVAELEPRFALPYQAFAWTHEQRGEYDRAIEVLLRARSLVPENTAVLGALARVHARAQHIAEAKELLTQLEQIARTRYVSPIRFAEIYEALGDHDQALAQLEAAYQARCSFLTTITDPLSFKSLRNDPRFRNLLARLRIPG